MNQHLTQISAFAAKTLPLQVSPHAKASLDRLEHLQALLTKTPPVHASALAWDRFLTLPLQRQEQIEASWDFQSSLLEAALRAGMDPFLEREMLDFVLARLGLEPDPSLLAQLSPGDSVEIESWDSTLAYRSLSNLSLGRLSLVELSTLSPGYGKDVAEKIRARLISQGGEPFTLIVRAAEPATN